MNKKLLALLLSILMLASCFMTACQSDKTDTEESGDGEVVERDDSFQTLSLWLPTYEGTTDEAIAQVQSAINLLTTTKYSTAIELNLIPSDQYEETIKKKFNTIEENLKKQEEGVRDEIVTDASGEEVTTEGESHVVSIGGTTAIYPAVKENQLDIFLIRGYEDYIEYYDDEIIEDLTSELSSTGKALSQYIYPTFLEMSQIYGSNYAIPNNKQIGEYKFLLVNKEISDLYYQPEDLSTLIRCEQFIDLIKEHYPEITPMLAPVEEPAGIRYFSIDGSRSLVSYVVSSSTQYGRYAEISSTLNNNTYTNTVKMMKKFEEIGGYFAEDPENCDEFGVGIVSGGYEVYEKYSDKYYVHIYEYPTAETEDIFGNMFAISKYTKNLSRAMEILTMINTDPALRTVLQYGAENVHWMLDEKDNSKIVKLSDNYNMNLNETGNVFMTYPDYGVSMDYWDDAKSQNLESIVSPFIMFELEVNDYNRSKLEDLKDYSEELFGRLEAASSDEFNTVLSDIRAELKESELLAWMLDATGMEGDQASEEKKHTIAYQYDSFASENGITPPVTE